MDTSKEYIKMCEKAEEVQKMRKFISGEYFYGVWKTHCGDIVSETPEVYIFDYCEDCWYTIYPENYDEGDENKYDAIWLPRQAQLQEMVGGTSYYKVSAIYELCNRISSHNDVNAGKCSMEQLWLAFVMKEKYNKIWNGNEWVKQ